MSGRRVALMIGGTYLLVAVVLNGYQLLAKESGPDEVGMGAAVQELEQFNAPAGATPLPVEVPACEGGLSPSAERRFRVRTSTTAAADELASQAVELGWTPVGREAGMFKRDGTLLVFGGWEEDDVDGVVTEGVSLSIVVRGDC